MRSVWLRLILMHVAGGLSLEQTVVRAREVRSGRSQCGGFIQAAARRAGLAVGTHRQPAVRAAAGLCSGAAAGPTRLRVVDATDIQEPGETGKGWRLHYSCNCPN